MYTPKGITRKTAFAHAFHKRIYELRLLENSVGFHHKKPDPRIHGGDVIIAFQSGAKVASKNLRETLGIAVSATSLIRPF